MFCNFRVIDVCIKHSEQLSFREALDLFEPGEAIQSPNFVVGDLEFSLLLFPNGRDDTLKGTAWLYLQIETRDVLVRDVQFELCLVDHAEREAGRSRYHAHFKGKKNFGRGADGTAMRGADYYCHGKAVQA